MCYAKIERANRIVALYIENNLSAAEIARQFNISRERVRQILNKKEINIKEQCKRKSELKYPPRLCPQCHQLLDDKTRVTKQIHCSRQCLMNAKRLIYLCKQCNQPFYRYKRKRHPNHYQYCSNHCKWIGIHKILHETNGYNWKKGVPVPRIRISKYIIIQQLEISQSCFIPVTNMDIASYILSNRITNILSYYYKKLNKKYKKRTFIDGVYIRRLQ